MKKINSNLAYAILCMHIDNLEKRYERFKILNVSESRLYSMLMSEEHRSTINKRIETADMAITGKLSRGEITPMMLPEKCRTRSSYIYYLRYLKNAVFPFDPVKADELASEAYKSILLNPLIENKDYFDEHYFSVLFANRRKYYVEQKTADRIFDGAIRKSV